jgi:acyl carrier protein
MALDPALPSPLRKERVERLRLGILSREGVDVFERALACGLPQVIVSTTDLATRSLRASAGLESPVSEATRPEPTEEKLASDSSAERVRPNLRTSYVAPRTELEGAIVEIWQELLGVEEVGVHDDFFELGGHSLLATRVIARIRKEYRVEISLRSLFEATTVAQLAERVGVILWATRGTPDSTGSGAKPMREIEL